MLKTNFIAHIRKQAQRQDASVSAVTKPSSVQKEVFAFLGRNTTFEGKGTFTGILRVDGRFEGEISGRGTLIIGESATIKGKVEVHAMVANGQVEGDVTSKERTEIHSKGEFHGNLTTPVIVINEGGLFEGQCTMEKTPDRRDVPFPPPKKDDTTESIH